MIRTVNILLLLVLFSTLGLAQSDSPTVTARITATVEDYIEMVTLSNIDVGMIIPTEDMLRLDPRSDQGAGLILISGQKNASAQIAFTAHVEMTNFASDIPLNVYYNISGNGENNQSASEIFTTNPMTVNLSSIGTYYLWIGCEFSLKDLVPGSYDGDFVIEVDYN
ncbi:MAG: hypothetical protein K9M49_04500 [Candidatus Marinimicrobia bacterium]|nr:hypothetical protein [Candidatus Neomarinimicrobiota bacterium]MCF7904397.1 hypothetical protein [Candidatus Neomarinimicrobiota bacterium]